MTLELIKDFISDHTLTPILALVTLAVVVWVSVMIIRRRRTEQLYSLADSINSIPFLAGLIPLSYLLSMINIYYHAFSYIHLTGGVDPFVAAAGLKIMFFNLSVSVGLFFIFLGVWLVMRMMYERFNHEGALERE